MTPTIMNIFEVVHPQNQWGLVMNLPPRKHSGIQNNVYNIIIITQSKVILKEKRNMLTDSQTIPGPGSDANYQQKNVQTGEYQQSGQ